jgi:hypothetical protein
MNIFLIIVIIIILILIYILFISKNEEYITEFPDTEHKILFLDIDDTLLTSDNIFVYFRKYLNSTNEIKLSPYDYKSYASKYPKRHFDFRDFDDPCLIRNSILNATPLTHNFDIIRHHINNGWDLGILTARGEEKEIQKIIGDWLQINLGIPFDLTLDRIHAVGDIHRIYIGNTFSWKKLNVLIWYWFNTKYDRIKLMDDNEETIDLIKSYLPHKFEYLLVTN